MPGNPFFLVTVVEELIRQGALVQQRAGWTLCRDLETVTVGVPESVRHLIEAQLEQLSVEERELLQAASVAGTEFAASLVATVLESGTEQVEAQGDNLVGRMTS